MLQVNDYPISVRFDPEVGIFSPCIETIERRVSDLRKVFYDHQAVQSILNSGDRLIYEVRTYPFITNKSDMTLGVTRIFPGKVGDEYHMTKGHIHERDDQPEIYYCVYGCGYLLMDTLNGQFRVEPLESGVIVHIPPMWAHRVVNTGNGLLVFVACFHVPAGHDYSLIERQGFTQIVVESYGKPTLIPNKKR
jgi:glucose-6-phosphate isomerase